MTPEQKERLYTIRWHVRERWGGAESRATVLDLLGEILDPESTPAERPSASGTGAKLLWCPFAQTDFPASPTRGVYAGGYPRGAVVHFTAGRHRSLASEIAHQVKSGFTYFVIGADGTIAQNFPLDSWGHHAGISKWRGLGESVSSKLVGIEVQCAGKLSKQGSRWVAWFGEAIPDDQTRTIKTNTAQQQQAGTYHRYTDEQEAALIRLLVWLRDNNPDVFQTEFVLGHDEVSGPKGIGKWRKNDPGGSLSMTMDQFRAHLKTL